MNERQITAEDQSSERKPQEIPSDDPSTAGLTDDERVSREGESEGEGARVKLGPADLERVSKPE